MRMPPDLVSGRLVAWEHDDPARVVLRYERVVAEVSVGSDGVVRTRAAIGATLPPETAVALGRDAWRPSPVEAHEQRGAIRLHCDEDPGVEIAVDAAVLSVRIGFRGCPGTEVRELRFGAEGGVSLAVRTASDARYFGFGEKSGRLDKRGSVLTMRTRDVALLHGSDPLYVSIPFFLVATPPRAMGVFLDCLATSVFDVAKQKPDEVRIDAHGGALDLYVVPGPAPADVVRRFTGLVGRTPQPPRWALGHHQSRWSYASESEVRRIATELRAKAIPTDAVHLDIDYMDGFRVFTWNPHTFPSPAALAADLDVRGFRMVAIVDPGVKVDPAYDIFSDGLAHGMFCRRSDGSLYSLRVWPGEAALPDFQREEVRAWWADRHQSLLGEGIAGIWNDMNEPAGWRRDLRLGRLIVPIRGQDTRDLRQADPADPHRLVAHEDVRNAYGHQECRATVAAFEKWRPGERPFVLTRSGYAGIQRFAAVWTGDNASNWADLRRSVPMLLNLSMSGVAFCGADIGGFSLSCTSELYARWIQLGALYPFARTHSMWLGRLQEPQAFGPTTEDIARRALELRMRLMPYLVSLFREAERSGAPVWRPLYHEFPDDPESYAVEDQVMLGPSLLLAPVMRKRARRRSVYLPPGQWCDFRDGSVHGGGRRVEVDAPLAHLPVFVRCPAVLPMQSVVQHAGERPAEPLILQVFAPRSTAGQDDRSSTGELWVDDGATLAYRDGAWARTRLRVTSGRDRVTLEVSDREGDFRVAPRPVRVVLRGAASARDVRCDGLSLPIDEGRESGALWARRRGIDLEIGYLDDGRGTRFSIHFDIDPA